MRSQLAETSGARWTLGIAAAVIVTVLGALMATVGGKADISQIAALREQVEENSRRINSAGALTLPRSPSGGLRPRSNS